MANQSLPDAGRNCISNVRDGGLSHADAAHRLRTQAELAYPAHVLGRVSELDRLRRGRRRLLDVLLADDTIGDRKLDETLELLHRERVARLSSLRTAWVCFLVIPIAHLLFTLIRIGGVKEMVRQSPSAARDAMTREIWNNGIVAYLSASVVNNNPPATMAST